MGVVGVYENGHLGVSFYVGRCVLREWIVGGGGLVGYFGNRDCQWASRSVLKDFTEDVLTMSDGSLSQNKTAQMVKSNWRRRAKHFCWWNFEAWLRSPLQVGCAKVDAMGNSRRPL